MSIHENKVPEFLSTFSKCQLNNEQIDQQQWIKADLQKQISVPVICRYTALLNCGANY